MANNGSMNMLNHKKPPDKSDLDDFDHSFDACSGETAYSFADLTEGAPNALQLTQMSSEQVDSIHHVHQTAMRPTSGSNPSHQLNFGVNSCSPQLSPFTTTQTEVHQTAQLPTSGASPSHQLNISANSCSPQLSPLTSTQTEIVHKGGLHSFFNQLHQRAAAQLKPPSINIPTQQRSMTNRVDQNDSMVLDSSDQASPNSLAVAEQHVTTQDDGFQEVARKKLKRLGGGNTSKHTPVSNTKEVSSNKVAVNANRFAILDNLNFNNNVLLSGIEKTFSDKIPSPKPLSGSRGVSNSFKVTCPPIILFNVNIKSLVDQLNSMVPKVNFKIKNINKFKSKLFLDSAEAHSEMMTILDEKKVDSYSFTPKEFRQISLVLRGLYFATDLSDLKYELDRLAPGAISKVSKFTTPFSSKNKSDTGLFLISLSPGKKLGDVANIRYVLNQAISWESPKSKSKEIQCWRCQQWGHISRNCNRQFTCVKCGSNHNPGECALGRDENDKPFCSNCKQAGHPANWRGCPSFQNYLLEKKKRLKVAAERNLTAARNVSQAFSNSKFNQKKSFASLFQSQLHHVAHPQASTPNRPTVVEEFLKLSKLFIEPEPSSLEQLLKNFLSSYKSMPISQAKSEFRVLLSRVNSIYGP